MVLGFEIYIVGVWMSRIMVLAIIYSLVWVNGQVELGHEP